MRMVPWTILRQMGHGLPSRSGLHCAHAHWCPHGTSAITLGAFRHTTHSPVTVDGRESHKLVEEASCAPWSTSPDPGLVEVVLPALSGGEGSCGGRGEVREAGGGGADGVCISIMIG
jgi:hypothetical protein